jgi:hypothetical protein
MTDINASIKMTKTAASGGSSSVSAGLTFDLILDALRAASPEQLAEFLELSRGGHDIWVEKYGSAGAAAAAAPTKTKAEPRERVKRHLSADAEPKPKKEKAAPVAVPFPDDGSVPCAASYRIKPEDIDHTVCVGRVMKDGVDDDKRWKPAVYRERQCGAAVDDGCDMCSGCTKRSEKAAETGKHGAWNGRVTEEPPAWCHMLGTAWAAKCKWNPDGDSASVASAHSSHAEKMDAAAKKGAKVDKEAAKAEKEAAKAKEKAEKEAAKAKEKAEKEAAKAKEKAEKESAKKAKPTKKAATSAVSVGGAAAAAAADTSAPVATVAGELEVIGHTMYWVRDGNVYEYDEETRKAGTFVGRKMEDGSIDEDGDEVVEPESDSD